MSTPIAIRAGGGVLAIIPQDIEQVWRLAGIAWQGGMAPKSLIDKKTPAEAQAACAIAIMAGAELGLTPMMALRSYAVVNGRPSLWGDGIKAVVRQSGLCEYIKTGSDQSKGWCEAKRKDTGEIKLVEFTIEQAKAAKLDQKEGPWKQGYADVMMERRATNRCLNDLFADVLGGIASAAEAYEDGPIDITPTRQSERPTAPMPPDDDEEDEEDETELHNSDRQEGGESEVANEFDPVAFLTELDERMTENTTAKDVELVWDELDVAKQLEGDTDNLALAETVRARHLGRVTE